MHNLPRYTSFLYLKFYCYKDLLGSLFSIGLFLKYSVESHSIVLMSYNLNHTAIATVTLHTCPRRRLFVKIFQIK